MKITLLCALGMSTSLLVERMKKAASRRELDVKIEAHSVDEIDRQLKDSDVMLLGPQIRYKKKELFKKAEKEKVPIAIIDIRAYGATDGEKVLEQALHLKNNDEEGV
ncbi:MULTISPECIES: PTS sugar transporter subunit IIB [Virgibacillus]|uniref:Lichenan-specific phosphotransferase enzyme IIB component n=1 Tax=Virgibacillus dokdonensis TaxID=302167 RepID=A0A2K9IVN4_9BACI|nr:MULTISPECIES: PTS sugar transporter subunit IIB [Virgibacillus]AUJ23535.1 Lichenan-specific phosphotransferase enzyme IIB component [Virgibacillus dokdonensis]NWO14913.1 PTS sugar transporter subunit IIB [Virgibacillus sp.]